MLTSRRTITSDFGIVVVLPGPPAPYRETLRVNDWVVELFVRTPTSMTYYWNLEIESFKAPLLRMCAEGHVVPAEKLIYRRYVLTDLLDDFCGATTQTELIYIASALLNSASELTLLSDSCWLGSGKWLARHLADVDAGLLDRLMDGQRALLIHGDRTPMERAVIEVLERAGGPITEGYRVDGEDPDRNSLS